MRILVMKFNIVLVLRGKSEWGYLVVGYWKEKKWVGDFMIEWYKLIVVWEGIIRYLFYFVDWNYMIF